MKTRSAVRYTYFINGKFPTWRDLKAAALTWNMHEG